MRKRDKVEGSLDRFDRFNQALEQVLETGEVYGEQLEHQEVEMLFISRELASADLASLSKKRSQVRERLKTTNYRTTKPSERKVRWAFGLAALLVLVVMSLALVPPLRAWAEEVIAQVGHLFITDGQTSAEKIYDQLQTATPGERKVFTVVTPSLEAVRRQVDFPVLAPRNFPISREPDIYEPPWAADGDMTWTSESVFNYQDGVTVIGIYKRWYRVHIHQLKVLNEQSQEFPVSGARTHEVVVRKQPGYWFEAAPTGLLESYGSMWPNDKIESVWVLEHQNLLIWEENGIVYIIQADDELDLEDLLVIAEALSEE
ncbi:MAG: hypothetical protein IBX69_04340 [Anaerolineales bacterium]|nr:hypothetical protein [Anaerolineales bacterium]